MGHSTETALLKITDDINLNLSQNIPTGVVLLDLSAAFDTIDHHTLLQELSYSYGIGGMNGSQMVWKLLTRPYSKR